MALSKIKTGSIEDTIDLTANDGTFNGDVFVSGTVSATSFIGDGSNLTGVSGGLLQTIQTHSTTLQTITGTSFVQISSLNTAITPSSTSNKVLITVQINIGAGGDTFPAFRLYRGSTWIGGSATVSPGEETTFANAVPTGGASVTVQMGIASYTYLDSPSTTSSVTYSVYCRPMNTASRTVNLNQSHSRGDNNQYSGTSTMILQEVT